MASDFQLMSNPVLPLFCHAWNKDRTKVCVSPGNNKAMIYGYDGKTYTLETTFEDHTATITGIDWSVNNEIATCGHDRNAYVYTLDASTGVWDPKLVILRINRAATCVKWSPNGSKFAVGSGARLVSVCYYEDDNDWWVSKHIKAPIRSTVLSVDWHPNNWLLAVGTADFKCRVFFAAVKAVDKKVEPKPGDSEWGPRAKFGEMLREFPASTSGGWVHSVSFSHDGHKIAFAAHDAAVYVADADADCKLTRLPCKSLPYRTVSWVSASEFVAAGFDYVPALFAYDGAAIKYLGELDKREVKASTSSFRALDKFRNLDSKGTAASSDLETKVNTTHQNCIADLQLHSGDKANAESFSTVGSDGKIVVWKLATARQALK